LHTLNVQTTASIYISRENRTTPLHLPAFASHSSYEIYILASGKRNIFIGTKLFSTEACDVALIPPDVAHRSFGTAHKGISLEFTKEYLEKNFADEMSREIENCFKRHIITLPEELLCKMWDSEPEKLDMAGKKKFLTELVEALKIHSGDVSEEEKFTFNNDLFAIGTYIQENYLEIKSLDELAEHFDISKSYLCRIFKKRTGLTVITYLNSLKLQYACKLLLETDLPINEISRMCGFKSDIYFTRVFKKLMECTPSQKRKKDMEYLF